MSEQYILDAQDRPIAEPDLCKWVRWMRGPERRVWQTRIGEVCVSTVFLGLNHGYPGGKKLLWETMVFGGSYHEFQRRYETCDEAMRGHIDTVNMVLDSDFTADSTDTNPDR